jgi:hypothetical protein
MLQARYRGPPMMFGNMRAQHVRSLLVTCELCRHVMNVDRFGDDVPVPAFRLRMICTCIHAR